MNEKTSLDVLFCLSNKQKPKDIQFTVMHQILSFKKQELGKCLAFMF